MAGRAFPLTITITAIDRLTGPLNRISARLQAVTAPFRPLANSLASLNQASGLSRIAGNFQGVASTVNDVGRAVDRTALRVGVLGFLGVRAATLFKTEFIDTADAANRMRISFDAVEGSAEKGAAAMAFIRKMTVETPFERMDIARAFRTMRGQGLDPMGGALKAIVEQTAKLGGTGDDMVGMAAQLGQAWGKTRLMAQDANILVERGVPVWGLLERAIARVQKRTIKDGELIPGLRKASEQGLLGRKHITLLFEQMTIESKGASEKTMKTWSGMISNLSDHWTFFKEDVMGLDDTGLLRPGGLMDRLNQRLGSMLTRLGAMSRSGELQRWAQRVGDTFMRGFTWLENNGPRILGQVVNNVQAIWNVADKVATAFGGWGNLVTAGVAAYIAGPLIGAVANLAIAITALNAGLIGTPAGWLLLGGAAAVGVAGWALFKGLNFAQNGPGGEPSPVTRTLPAWMTSPMAAPVPIGGGAAALPSFQPRNRSERLERLEASIAEASRQRSLLQGQLPGIAASLAEASRTQQQGKLTVKIEASRDLRVRTETGGTLPIDLSVGRPAVGRHMPEVP